MQSDEFKQSIVDFMLWRREQLLNENDFLRRGVMKDIPLNVLMAVRKKGIDGRFEKYSPEMFPDADEFPAFFECPLCGKTEFRILRTSINCRQFRTPCCNHTVSLHIRGCPCTSNSLECLEKPIISTFYIYTDRGGDETKVLPK
jgi:hypothetical protein